MNTLFFFVAIMNILSLGFLFLSLSRLKMRLGQSNFEESKYTLLFGFARIGTYRVLYATSVIVCTVILLLMTLPI